MELKTQESSVSGIRVQGGWVQEVLHPPAKIPSRKRGAGLTLLFPVLWLSIPFTLPALHQDPEVETLDPHLPLLLWLLPPASCLSASRFISLDSLLVSGLGVKDLLSRALTSFWA